MKTVSPADAATRSAGTAQLEKAMELRALLIPKGAQNASAGMRPRTVSTDAMLMHLNLPRPIKKAERSCWRSSKNCIHGKLPQ